MSFMINIRTKKISLVSGNRLSESFFITHPPAEPNFYQNIHFSFQKTKKQAKKTRKQKNKRH